jgi:hypothetical protein
MIGVCEMLKYLADLLILLGCLLILVGVYLVLPVLTWFVAGGMCILVGVVFGIGRRKIV